MGSDGSVPRLAWVGAAVVVASLLIGLGVAIGRGSGATVSSATSTIPVVPGGQVVVGPPPQVIAAATSAGPTRVDHGVPVGYAHSRDGALMAAVTFTRVFGSRLLLHPDAYRAALQVMAAPAHQADMRAKAETVLSTVESRRHLISNAARGLPVALNSYTLRARVTVYSDAAASVELFGALLLTDGESGVIGSFAGGSYTLAWTVLADGTSDWRIAAEDDVPAWQSLETRFPDAPGPQPAFLGLEEVSDAPPTR